MKKDDAMKPEQCAVNSQLLAIIGMGCFFPQSEDAASYWAAIKNGVDAITEIPPTHWKTADYFADDPKSPDRTYGSRGGFIAPVDFNPLEYGLPPNVLEATDTSQILGMMVAGEALKDAGYGPDRSWDRERVSVILGVTGTLELVIPLGARLGHPLWRKALAEAGVEELTAEDVVQRISDSYVPWQENSFPGLLGNVVAGRISKQYDLGGTNCVVDAACASSLSALHLAGLELTAGRADMVVTGGVDTFNDIFMYMCFSKTPALSPTGNARPFDASGDGTILGEGLGMVVLKRLVDAERDGDRIYAVIRGIGSSSDGKGDAIYAPSATGQQKALRAAYRAAGITPESVELIEAHGTGTKVGDAVEVSALREVFGEAEKPWCAVGSVKAQIGHTKAAAGAAGLIKAALALHNKVLPPTIKVKEPLAEITSGKTPFYLNTEKRPWIHAGGHPRRAGVSAFGFGGSNFHCIVEEYRPEKEQTDWDGDVQIIPFSAPDRAALAERLNGLTESLQWKEVRSLAARCRADFNPGDTCRLVLVVERQGKNSGSLAATARAMLADESRTSWSTPDGAYFFCGDTPGGLAMLFPGQGAQYTGMLRDLACQFPEMLNALEGADRVFMPGHGRRLTDLIYPHPSFAPEGKQAAEAALRATDVAQPAIGAVSMGAANLLQTFGIRPEAVAGHSYGELTALCAAGCFSEPALHLVSGIRGRLMAEGQGDKGAMLAVAAPLAVIEEIVAAEKLDLVLANRNAPDQAVLSGTSEEIARAEEVIGKKGITCKVLPVAAAFHSPLVADASAPFLAALEDVPFREPEAPVYSNTTAAPYPSDAASARQLLGSQLAKPVEFVAQIEAMYAAGIRTFVEAGPGARLTGLVKSILNERPHNAVAIDASSGRRSGIVDFARALAQLAAVGHQVKLSMWDAEFAAKPAAPQVKKPAMTIPICGANYMKPRPQRPPVKSPVPHAGHTQLQPIALSHAPQPQPQPGSAHIAEALRVSRESMVALQKLHEQTAQLHRQFLEGQEAAGRTIQALLEQQQRLMAGSFSSASPQPFHAPIPEVNAQRVAATVAPQPAPAEAAVLSAPSPAQPAGLAERTLLDVISERTGYPVEMLELDMSLDADLGIDSIKRVEILSTLQERLPEAPAVKPEHLGTLQTLRQIVSHLDAGLSPQSAPLPAAPQAAPAHPAQQTLSSGRAEQALLEVISERTGYPVEMLELDMSLDADLGIDSIKRVEILSALQERLPDAPAVKPEHLGTLQTLRQIVAHLEAGAPSATTVIVPLPAAAQAPHSNQPTLAAGKAEQALLDVISDRTGYPVEMLELDMALDADLGIDSIKRVEILSALQERLPEAPAVKPEHLGTLQTLRQIVAHLEAGDSPAAAAPVAPTPAPSSPKAALHSPDTLPERSVLGIAPLDTSVRRTPLAVAAGAEIWVMADASPLTDRIAARLDSLGYRPRILTEAGEVRVPASLGGLLIVSPTMRCDREFFLQTFALLQKAAPGLKAGGAAGGATFVTVSRLDGRFGLAAGSRITDALSGGLAGLAKTAHREWPEVHCKALDLAGDIDDAEFAAAAIAEEMFLSGPREVGITTAGRFVPEMTHAPLVASPRPLDGGTVVISGGGRGVTAEIAVALARQSRVNLLLLGRTAEPAPESAWLVRLAEDGVIKKGLLEQFGPMSPKQLEEQFRALMANRELARNLDRIRAAGATVIYRSVNISDPEAVKVAIDDARNGMGPVTGVIHGAGVLADRRIEDKTPEQFAMVYDTKVEGLRALLGALERDDLRFLALFSSSTGRFGRVGQSDYAVANEILNKIAQEQSRLRPDCRVVSINWGPWDGGMVTPSLKKLFAAEGVGVIGLEAGAEHLLREISEPSQGAVESVVIGAAEKTAVSAPAKPAAALALAVEMELSIDRYPFLTSHVINGKAVLPMAMIIEWMAHGTLHNNPGFRLHGFNDLRILKGVIFDRDKPCAIRILTGKARKRDAFHTVPVELVSGTDGREILHARAEILLATKLPEGIRSITELPARPYPFRDGEFYSQGILFHGPDLQGIVQVDACSPEGIVASVKSAPAPVQWIAEPLRNSWLTDPLAVDCAFQLMILWSFERSGKGSLPTFAGRYRQFQESFPKDGVQIVIHVTRENEQSATADMEFFDQHNGKLVARLEGYECVIDASLNSAFRRNRLPQHDRVELGAA